MFGDLSGLRCLNVKLQIKRADAVCCNRYIKLHSLIFWPFGDILFPSKAGMYNRSNFQQDHPTGVVFVWSKSPIFTLLALLALCWSRLVYRRFIRAEKRENKID